MFFATGPISSCPVQSRDVTVFEIHREFSVAAVQPQGALEDRIMLSRTSESSSEKKR